MEITFSYKVVFKYDLIRLKTLNKVHTINHIVGLRTKAVLFFGN